MDDQQFHVHGRSLPKTMRFAMSFRRVEVRHGKQSRYIFGSAEIARLDNAAPYRKGGHRETCFSVRADAHYKLMFAARSII